MKLLAIETATEACSVALYLDGEVRESYRLAPREHARLVLAMADGLLAEASLQPSQLDAVAFSRGPGAFTGVRIATSVVQGIAFAAELPVVPVSTLAALAQGGCREFGWQHIAAAIDARMDEVYWGVYECIDGLVQPRQAERVCQPGTVPTLQGEGWYGIGSGWAAYGDALKARLGSAVGDSH
ncbi:MAG TPA: tRNA (adenosine(37)-N6)-threonylcarbamoyltransferase complex dimerization subunit type 1 TsaB, partial [Gammaproteobacteria bacterium]